MTRPQLDGSVSEALVTAAVNTMSAESAEIVWSSLELIKHTKQYQEFLSVIQNATIIGVEVKTRSGVDANDLHARMAFAGMLTLMAGPAADNPSFVKAIKELTAFMQRTGIQDETEGKYLRGR